MGSVVDFLLKARRKVYRSGANPAGSSVPTSYDLEYQEDEFYYRSTSLGGLYTATQERVWKNGKPVWAINIMGRIVADGFQGSFLREALLQINHTFPFRGPQEYKQGDYVYLSRIEGDVSWFSGIEEIYFHDKLVYEARFQGGALY